MHGRISAQEAQRVRQREAAAPTPARQRVNPMGPQALRQNLASGTAPARPTRPGNGAHPLTKIRTLIADDEPVERLRLSSLLASAGLEVIAVATGADVVEAVTAWEPKVVVLSWPLQGGGLELVRQLVEELGMGGRVILISALVDVRDQHAALGAGATHYFIRPADPERLIAAIRRAA